MSAPIATDEYEDGMEPEDGSSSRIRPLEHDEVKSIVQREIDDALGNIGTDLSDDRRKAIEYYYGKPFGNEQAGRSSVVLEDVRDTIEWAMPNIMRMLCEGSVIGRYVPIREQDAEDADLATDYVNHLLMNKLNGYAKMYDWFKTGLLEKVGFIKVYIEEREEPKIRTYFGLTEEELQVLLAEPNAEPIAMSQREDSIKDPQSGETIPLELYDVKIRTVEPKREIKIDGIPPEEVLTGRGMIEFGDDSSFIAHRKKVRISDLIAMGFDPEIVLDLPSDDMPEFQQSRVERLADEGMYPDTTGERADEASREVWLTECYIRIDEDGDGYAELRKITVCGDSATVILEDEEISFIPIATLCPIPMPHKFYGISLADLVMDLQLIRSTLLRQSLDNLYLTNNSRVAVVEGMVNVDDLLVSRPGGVVRTRMQGAIEPLTVPPMGMQALGMMEFLEGVKEQRTGITRYNQGQDAGSLNKTATGITRIMNASYARLELIAKLYSEIGLRRFFKIMLRLLVEGGFKSEQVQMNGKWVQVDPATWDVDMDIAVEVGMGIGQAAERMDQLQQIIGLQSAAVERGLGGYLVEPQHFYNVVSDLTRAMGQRIPSRYFADPAQKGPPPEPPPDPAMVKVQQDGQAAQAEQQLKAQTAQTDAMAKVAIAEFRVEELEETMKLEREKLQAEKEIAKQKVDSAERIATEKVRAEKERAKIQATQAKRETKE